MEFSKHTRKLWKRQFTCIVIHLIYPKYHSLSIRLTDTCDRPCFRGRGEFWYSRVIILFLWPSVKWVRSFIIISNDKYSVHVCYSGLCFHADFCTCMLCWLMFLCAMCIVNSQNPQLLRGKAFHMERRIGFNPVRGQSAKERLGNAKGVHQVECLRLKLPTKLGHLIMNQLWLLWG